MLLGRVVAGNSLMLLQLHIAHLKNGVSMILNLKGFSED